MHMKLTKNIYDNMKIMKIMKDISENIKFVVKIMKNNSDNMKIVVKIMKIFLTI